MAEDQKDKPTAREAAKEAAADKREARQEDTPLYPREMLIDDGLTDYPAHIVAGALEGLPKSQKNLSIDEVNAACKAWLTSPVKEG